MESAVLSASTVYGTMSAAGALSAQLSIAVWCDVSSRTRGSDDLCGPRRVDVLPHRHVPSRHAVF